MPPVDRIMRPVDPCPDNMLPIEERPQMHQRLAINNDAK